MRIAWLLAALLQVALPGAAAIADARLDAAGLHAAAHVESHTSSTCARVHAPDCALCHFLTVSARPTGTAGVRLDIATDLAARPVDRGELPQLFARPHSQPRAPPTLS